MCLYYINQQKWNFELHLHNTSYTLYVHEGNADSRFIIEHICFTDCQYPI